MYSVEWIGIVGIHNYTYLSAGLGIEPVQVAKSCSTILSDQMPSFVSLPPENVSLSPIMIVMQHRRLTIHVIVAVNELGKEVLLLT